MSLDFWRNLAVIWLCFQGFFLLLVPLALCYFLVRGMGWVLRNTDKMMHKAQGYSRIMRNKTEAVADKVAQPVIHAHGRARGAAAGFNTLFGDEPSRAQSISPALQTRRNEALETRTLDRSATTRKDSAWRINRRAQE